LVYVVLVAGILLGATTIVGLFGSTGASIGGLGVGKQTVVTNPNRVGRGEGRHG
jgi:type IV secretion system protein VirB2